MIRVNIPGFSESDSGGPRWGDCQIIDDGKNYLVIDGYCGIGTTRLINRLKKLKVKSPVLFISHAHYDHYYGIRKIVYDKYFTPKALYCYDPESINASFSASVRSERNILKSICAEANARSIPVKYLKNGQTLKFGDITFVVYRSQPSKAENSDAYLNNGSLCFWFPDLGYFTSGDGPEKIYDLCKKNGIKPKFFKIPHHGNNCPQSQANGMAGAGALWCWDNDISTNYTEFLKYGRKRCIEAGIRYFNCIGDINFIAKNGKVTLYKNGNGYSYSCKYKGKATLTGANLSVARDILRGTYGSGESRVTNLIDAGKYPKANQDKANEVIRLAKDIYEGKVNYGKGSERIARIDKELGKGYGQLVQDYINVLAGVKKSV